MDDRPNDKLESTPCPGCSRLTLRIEMRFQGKELGTWSLAGVQSKLNGRMWPYLYCTSCGISAPAKED